MLLITCDFNGRTQDDCLDFSCFNDFSLLMMDMSTLANLPISTWRVFDVKCLVLFTMIDHYDDVMLFLYTRDVIE